jgi:hypothetical protein
LKLATYTPMQKMQRSLEAYKPKALSDLIRIGNKFDGGYVINRRSIDSSKYLISFGVNDDWQFEADFLRRKPDLKVFCFDHSVSRKVFRKKMENALNEVLSFRFLVSILSLNFKGVRDRLAYLKDTARTWSNFSSFLSQDNVQFFSKGISNEGSEQFVTLKDVFQMIPQDNLSENSVFLKMDIEQSEFRVLPELSNFEPIINGMAIEFHDLDITWPSFVALMSSLQDRFEVTHIHGNNFAGLIPDSSVPKVLEITFLKRALIREGEVDRRDVIYPIAELDQPNNRFEKDYSLRF